MTGDDHTVGPSADEHEVGAGQEVEIRVGGRPNPHLGSQPLGDGADHARHSCGVAGAALVEDSDLHDECSSSAR